MPLIHLSAFRTYICVDCLTGTIDPITLSDFRRLGFAVFKPGHICKQEDLEIRKRRAEKKLYVDVIKKWDELRLLSIRYLANIVHQWVGPNKDIHMKVIEERDLKSQIADSLPTNLGKTGKSHWAYRTLNNKEENKRTVIDDTELMDFLNLASATFAPFRAEMDGKEHYFYLYICPILMSTREIMTTMFTVRE